MKTGAIIGISAIAIIIIYLIVQLTKRNSQQQPIYVTTGGTQDQINQQCKDNWLCATSTILGGLGGVLSNFNFGSQDEEPSYAGAQEFTGWEQYDIA